MESYLQTTLPGNWGLWVLQLFCTPPHVAPRLLPSSRESFRIFQKLSEIFSDENNYSLSRELLIKVESGVRERVASHSL